MAGGLDLFILLQVRPHCSGRGGSAPHAPLFIALFFVCVAACLRGGVALGVRYSFGRAVLFPFGVRVPLGLGVLSHLRRAAPAPCCPAACAPEK